MRRSVPQPGRRFCAPINLTISRNGAALEHEGSTGLTGEPLSMGLPRVFVPALSEPGFLFCFCVFSFLFSSKRPHVSADSFTCQSSPADPALLPQKAEDSRNQPPALGSKAAGHVGIVPSASPGPYTKTASL